MEVGEHIPPQFNRPFVANLVSHATKGMVLSWSNVCDKGVGHVNCKSEDQVIGMMRAEAFDYGEPAEPLNCSQIVRVNRPRESHGDLWASWSMGRE
jgi:hypothetical protein